MTDVKKELQKVTPPEERAKNITPMLLTLVKGPHDFDKNRSYSIACKVEGVDEE